MRTREIKLTADERRAFERAERETRRAAELRRLQGVRMYGTGMDLETIQQVTGAPRRTLANWVAAFQTQGLEGLKDGQMGGNNRVLTQTERAQVVSRLQQVADTPVNPGKPRFVDIEQVQQVVEQATGKQYRSRESYRQLLIEAGFSFQHPEGVYRSRPSEAVIAEFESDAEKK